MNHFEIDQTKREALTLSRAKELLADLTHGVESVKLSGKSFGDGSAAVAADALQRAAPSLKRLDIADIIASRPEEEAKRTLATIADSLTSCKHLTFIDLSDNALGAKGIRAVGGLLAGQTALEELLLCNNGLAADAGNLITASLLETSPTALVKLHFHNNLLETAGSIALAPVVENSPNLADFRFSSLRLSSEGAVRICNALQPKIASTLVKLNLSDNTFGDDGASALADALSDAPLLETLLVRDAGLGDRGVMNLCNSLAKNAPKLTALDISGNEAGLLGAKGLARLLVLGKLKELLAEDNEFGSNGAVRLVKGIKGSTGLEKLDIRSSEIGGRGALALAKACAKLEKLRLLDVNGNAIPEEVVCAIEEVLGDRLGSLSDNDEDGDDDGDDTDGSDYDDDEDDDDDDDIDSDVAEENVDEAVLLKDKNGELKKVEKPEMRTLEEVTSDLSKDDTDALAVKLSKVSL